ncbi:hypothetical protein EDD86DRAFT_249147 [Gorgonomyces haynaldii]|nr:hypothetical protein EDD86DRAFT_249147 [Gorgonomyces haynaldii]
MGYNTFGVYDTPVLLGNMLPVEAAAFAASLIAILTCISISANLLSSKALVKGDLAYILQVNVFTNVLYKVISCLYSYTESQAIVHWFYVLFGHLSLVATMWLQMSILQRFVAMGGPVQKPHIRIFKIFLIVVYFATVGEQYIILGWIGRMPPAAIYSWYTWGGRVWVVLVVLYDVWQSLYQAYLIKSYVTNTAMVFKDESIEPEVLKSIMSTLFYLVIGVALLDVFACILFVFGIGGKTRMEHAMVDLANSFSCMHPLFFLFIGMEVKKIMHRSTSSGATAGNTTHNKSTGTGLHQPSASVL